MTSIASSTYPLLDGKAVSQVRLAALTAELAQLPANAPKPKLVVILVGDDAASQVYVGRKTKVAAEIGMASELIALPAESSQGDVLAQIDALNADTNVHGILVQLPLPKQLNTQAILHAVNPDKDVDGFHPFNLGRLLAGDADVNSALPCTPAGMMTLLEHYNLPIAGKHAVVVGRSTIVGKPMAQLLLQADATVTLCHSRTPDLTAHTRQADILVAAVGRPSMITADMVKPGATVLDVGINRLPDGRLVGDVDFDNVKTVAGAITPVPGGVGPMTIATLMENTVKLYRRAMA